MWPLIAGIIVIIVILIAVLPDGKFKQLNGITLLGDRSNLPTNGKTTANIRDLGSMETRADCERACADAWCKAYTWIAGKCYGLSSVPAETAEEGAMSGVKLETDASDAESFTIDQLRDITTSGVSTVSNTLMRRIGMSDGINQRNDNERFVGHAENIGNELIPGVY